MAVSDNTYFAPVLPDFSQFFGDIDKQSRKGGERAAKGFSDGVDKNLNQAQKAVEKYAKAQERAQDRAADAAGKTAIEHEKLNEVLEDSNSSVSKIRAATERYEKAQRDEARAAGAAEKASKDLADAQEQVAKASSEANDEFRIGANEMDAYGGSVDDASGKLKDFARNAAGIVGIAGIGATFAAGMDVSGAVTQMNNQLGLVDDAAESTADSVSKVMRSGFAGSVEEATGAVGALHSNIGYLGAEGEKTAEELAKPLLAFTSTFEADMDETTQTVSQLLNNGLAKDATEAFDLMTAAYQRVPAAMRDEIPEIMNEYGTYFNSMGMSGEDAFGLVVNAAANGKIEMDKVGDAIKEFGIRATDLGDTGAVEALDAIGLSSENIQSRLLAGGDSAREAFGQVVDGLMGITDPAEQAEAAVALFGTPLEDLDKSKIPGFLAGLDTAGGSMTDFAGSSQELSDTLEASLSNRIDMVKGVVLDLAGNAFMYIWDVMSNKVIPAFKDMADWAQRNSQWLIPLIGGFTAFATTLIGIVKAQQAYTAALGAYRAMVAAARAATIAFSASLWANPMVWIAAAIIGVIAALALFFTKTETGRKVWDTFTTAMANGWNWVVDTFTAGVDWVKTKWSEFSTALSNLWSTYVSPILTWIGDKWNWVQAAIGYAIDWVKFKIDYLSAAVSYLWSTYMSPILTWIGDKWDWLQGAMSAVINYLSDTAFEKFKSAVDGVKNFFSSVVDGIGNKWDSLKRLLAKPINFMINTVYNDGILRAWNVIAGILPGLEPGSEIGGIAEYNTGGHVAGPGTGTSDDIPAWLSNGEHVWTAAEVARVGGQAGMYAMRNAVASGRGFTYDGQGGVATLPGRPDNRAGDLAGAAPELLGVQAYATGGEVRPLWEAQLMRAHAFAQSQSGKPYQWAGPQGPGQSFDCSGFMGSVAAVIQGDDPWRRYWATGSFSGGNTAQGFVPGTGPGFSIGLFNGGPWGGHTAGTLSAAGQYGVANVESGGSPSMVKYGAGAGAVGADHGQFTHTYHLPIGADGAFVSGGAGGVSPDSMRSIIAEKLEGAIDTVMSPIVDRLPTKPPEWQGIPRGVYDSGKDGLVNFVSDSIGALGDKLASVHTAVSGMTDLVRDAATGAWDWITDRVDVFDTGGVLRPGGLAQNKSGHPELIINHAQLGAFNRLANALGISAESMQVVTKEISEAYAGRDWGYAELARVLGNEQWALAIVNGAADLGHFVRTYGDVIGEVTEAANSHFMDEAANVAGLFGLEDLVGLSLPEEFSPGNLRAAYANANNLYNDPDYIHPDNIDDDDTPGTPRTPTVTGVDDVNRVANAVQSAPSETNAGEVVRITANSSDDFVKVSDIEELDGRVVRLEIDRDESAKVPAAAVTRGGAM